MRYLRKLLRPSWRDEKLVEKLTRNTARIRGCIIEFKKVAGCGPTLETFLIARKTLRQSLRIFGKTTLRIPPPLPFDIKLLHPPSSPREISILRNRILHRRRTMTQSWRNLRGGAEKLVNSELNILRFSPMLLERAWNSHRPPSRAIVPTGGTRLPLATIFATMTQRWKERGWISGLGFLSG